MIDKGGMWKKGRKKIKVVKFVCGRGGGVKPKTVGGGKNFLEKKTQGGGEGGLNQHMFIGIFFLRF